MSELNKRDIWEVANQLEGYVGPETEERLAAFLMREGHEAAKLAERIVELEKELKKSILEYNEIFQTAVGWKERAKAAEARLAAMEEMK